MKRGNWEDKPNVYVLTVSEENTDPVADRIWNQRPIEGFDMTSTEATKINATLTAARAEITGNDYVPVADCVDWLLDCHNAAERPVVRDVVITLLPQFSNGNLRTTDEFNDALDQIELALAVDGAFEGTTVEARLD